MTEEEIQAAQVARASTRLGPRPGSHWRHYGGGVYTVLTCAVDKATMAPVVVYHVHQNFGDSWTLALAKWQELVAVGDQKVPRFDPTIPPRNR